MVVAAESRDKDSGINNIWFFYYYYFLAPPPPCLGGGNRIGKRALFLVFFNSALPLSLHLCVPWTVPTNQVRGCSAAAGAGAISLHPCASVSADQNPSTGGGVPLSLWYSGASPQFACREIGAGPGKCRLRFSDSLAAGTYLVRALNSLDAFVISSLVTIPWDSFVVQISL